MNIIFIGPPYAGKGTQAERLSKKLGLPVFSMGKLIREGYEARNPKAVEGFEKYSMKGLHLPNSLKFDLLKEKLDISKKGFIIDNYPATQEDLDTFLNYINSYSLNINKVFNIRISEEDMKNRIISRGRQDDAPEILLRRRKIQDKDRLPVINYFRNKGILVDIDGKKSIEEVEGDILSALKI